MNKRSKFYRILLQLNESKRPALFPSRKRYINVRKIDKNTRTPKGTHSGKQLFFQYPSVFAKTYVQCEYPGPLCIMTAPQGLGCLFTKL